MKKCVRYTILILLMLVMSIPLLMACNTAENNLIDLPFETHSHNETYQQEDIEITPISVHSGIEPIAFGKFPQSLKGDVNVSKVKGTNGYYLGSDGNSYAKIDNQYYVMEDILWDAFLLDSGDILLISRKILWSVRYDDYHDYFEREAQMWEKDLFYYTEEEKALMKKTGIEYSSGYVSSSKHKDNYFLLNVDTLTKFYPTKNKIYKETTTYASKNLKTNKEGRAVWWLAPKLGLGYYVTQDGAISNKNNTYLINSGALSKIAYSYRGVAPAMIISNPNA